MTRNQRSDVVQQAISVLDAYGLADLTMRRLAAELGVRPSALYHHFASKQLLLAAVADELLARGPRRPRPAAWDAAAIAVCTDLRDAVLAYRDGAELVATVHAFGLGAAAPLEELRATLAAAGFAPDTVDVGARTLLRLVLGHTAEEQTHLQADSLGALPDGPSGPRDASDTDFALGLDLVVDGLRLRLPAPRGARRGGLRDVDAP